MHYSLCRNVLRLSKGNHYLEKYKQFVFCHQIPIRMKTRITLVLALFFSLNAIAKTTPIPHSTHKTFSVNSFGSFNAHRQHNSAALSWIFNSPNVSTFIIKRSYDGVYFEVVGQQTPSSGHWTKFLDTSVEPGTIYYKVVAVLNGVAIEESAVAQVRIVKHR